MSSTITTAKKIADNTQKNRALAALRQALAQETGWVRVHAAEALIAVGEGAAARAAYATTPATPEAGAARTGAWRVLAATETVPAERIAWVAKLMATVLADGAPDRPQAIESLCKLRVPVSGRGVAELYKMIEGPERGRPLALWALGIGGATDAAARIAALLSSEDPGVRLSAAYALRWLQATDREVLARLVAAARAEPVDAKSRPYLISAVLALRADLSRDPAWREQADHLIATGPAGARYELCQALIQGGETGNPSRYISLLEHPEGDVRIGGAWLVLHLLAAHE